MQIELLITYVPFVGIDVTLGHATSMNLLHCDTPTKHIDIHRPYPPSLGNITQSGLCFHPNPKHFAQVLTPQLLRHRIVQLPVLHHQIELNTRRVPFFLSKPAELFQPQHHSDVVRVPDADLRLQRGVVYVQSIVEVFHLHLGNSPRVQVSPPGFHGGVEERDLERPQVNQRESRVEKEEEYSGAERDDDHEY